jgi:hypothetical protein
VRFIAIACSLAVLSDLTLTLSAASAATHDGHWSVLVVTEKGECDRAYRYEVTIADGQVSFNGDPGINLSGSVATNGAVKVGIRGGDRKADGTGRLSVDSGAGTWQGSGRTGACAGRWEAARR